MVINRVIVLRAVLGTIFVGAGFYTGYLALHPINNFALGVAGTFLVIGGLIADMDDVGPALTKLGQTKISITQ